MGLFCFTRDNRSTPNSSAFSFPQRVQTRIVRLDLACLIPKLVLLVEFVLTTKAAQVLLADFAGPNIMLVSQKLHERKCL